MPILSFKANNNHISSSAIFIRIVIIGILVCVQPLMLEGSSGIAIQVAGDVFIGVLFRNCVTGVLKYIGKLTFH